MAYTRKRRLRRKRSRASRDRSAGYSHVYFNKKTGRYQAAPTRSKRKAARRTKTKAKSTSSSRSGRSTSKGGWRIVMTNGPRKTIPLTGVSDYASTVMALRYGPEYGKKWHSMSPSVKSAYTTLLRSGASWRLEQ